MEIRYHLDEHVERGLTDVTATLHSSFLAWLIRRVCAVPCTRKVAAVPHGDGASSLCDNRGLPRQESRSETRSYLGSGTRNLLVLGRWCQYLERNVATNICAALGTAPDFRANRPICRADRRIRRRCRRAARGGHPQLETWEGTVPFCGRGTDRRVPHTIEAEPRLPRTAQPYDAPSQRSLGC